MNEPSRTLTSGWQMAQTSSIRNPYISVELKNGRAHCVSEALLEMMKDQDVTCELASTSLHISIAYAEGELETLRLQRTAEKIAAGRFESRAVGFEILEGQTTPFDYMVLTLEAGQSLSHAFAAVENEMSVKTFGAAGFRAHVSLVKFPKGALTATRREALLRELNASWGAAFALGQGCCLQGERVAIFNPERECCMHVAFAA